MQAPENSNRFQFTALISGTFLVTPILGLCCSVFFGLLSWEHLRFAIQQGSMVLMLAAMLLLVTVHFWRFTGTFFPTDQTGNQRRISLSRIHTKFSRFSLQYWGLFLGYSLIPPVIFVLIGAPGKSDLNAQFNITFFILQLTVSILGGMPAYLYVQDNLSRIVARTGLFKVQNSLKSRMLLLTGLIPLLSYALLIEYYWLNTGFLSSQTAWLWAALSVLTLTIVFLSITNLKQSLKPVEQALFSSGATTNRALGTIVPQSTNELGYLTQTLARVFQRLSDQETHMHAIIDNAAEGIIVLDENGLVDTFNLAAQKLFHFSSHEVRGKSISWMIPDMLDSSGTLIHKEGAHKINGNTRTGSPLSLAICSSEMMLQGRTMYIYLVEDISQREAALEKLQKAEAMYRDLVETAHDLVWSMDINGNWTYLNNACTKLYGLEPEDMIGRPVTDFQVEEYAEHENQAFEEIYQGKELYQFETVHKNHYGNHIHLSFNARIQKDDHGNIIGISGTAHDITDTKEYQRQLAYQAEHDALTGLYNRRFFQQELERVIARTARSGETSGLLYVDLDQFKYINDTLGHAAGDRLLIEISKLLGKHAREGDLLARFGGDEFTILLYDIQEHHIQQVAENFRRLMDSYQFFDSGKSFNVSCSIGAALIDESTRTPDEVMSHADLACNIAKSKGRNCVNVYNPDDNDQDGMAEDMGWAARVRDMIDNDRFILVYQPIVSTTDGRLKEYEVLIRMPLDDGQVILPGGFIPAAERFGLIHHLDRWIAHHAILNMADFKADGIEARFAINLSSHAYEDESLLPLIQDMINTTGINPSSLTFEISETAAITNLADATEFITNLKKMGCHTALDDFGSGFCSFSYLKKLPVDTLKIDGSIIRGLANNPVDRAMVQSMHQIGHALGKVTVAECVENQATLEILRELGIDYVQGHYLGKPVDHPGLFHTNADEEQTVPLN